MEHYKDDGKGPQTPPKPLDYRPPGHWVITRPLRWDVSRDGALYVEMERPTIRPNHVVPYPRMEMCRVALYLPKGEWLPRRVASAASVVQDFLAGKCMIIDHYRRYFRYKTYVMDDE